MNRVPVSELLQRLQGGKRILGLSFAPLSLEVAVARPPYTKSSIQLLRSGKFLEPEEIKQLLDEHAPAGGVLLGGSAAFKADGTTHFGVRKAISGLMGVEYISNSDWLPTPKRGHEPVPVWLCRAGNDDPTTMLQRFLKENGGLHSITDDEQS